MPYASNTRAELEPPKGMDWKVIGVRFASTDEESFSPKVYHYFAMSDYHPAVGDWYYVTSPLRTGLTLVYVVNVHDKSPVNVPLKTVWGKIDETQASLNKQYAHLINQQQQEKEEKMASQRAGLKTPGSVTPERGQYDCIGVGLTENDTCTDRYGFCRTSEHIKVGDKVTIYDPKTDTFVLRTVTWASGRPYENDVSPNKCYTATRAGSALSLKQGTKAMNPIKIEQRTYVNGTLAKDLSDDQIISFISEGEAAIKELSALETQSTKVAAKIEALKKGNTDLAALLDART